ncbi:M20/M25/M40 family metallo-hydrolase [Saccharopolyspora hattusasensis]|uniref:M20/M25/M40 family metallo-hydrolase n=1 Tax=Saccharopolyspora hattusasensis TaxID=1128679 RepID=UPI003D985C67
MRFMFNDDEELGSPMSRPHIERAAQDCLATLVLEPGAGWDVKTERKGVGIFTITTHGVKAHSGNNATDCASAIHPLAEIISQLTGEADHERGTTINVGTVSGGTARNVIAGKASCLIDIRVSATSLHTPLEPISVGVGSDANFVSALGLPVLDGLGASGDGDHARHEHVIVDDIPDRVALVAGVLSRIADARRELSFIGLSRHFLIWRGARLAVRAAYTRV